VADYKWQAHLPSFCRGRIFTGPCSTCDQKWRVFRSFCVEGYKCSAVATTTVCVTMSWLPDQNDKFVSWKDSCQTLCESFPPMHGTYL
jgi:hypothetical protein